jgi:hypothetical protein
MRFILAVFLCLAVIVVVCSAMPAVIEGITLSPLQKEAQKKEQIIDGCMIQKNGKRKIFDFC